MLCHVFSLRFQQNANNGAFSIMVIYRNNKITENLQEKFVYKR